MVASQPTVLVGHGLLLAGALDQNILDDLDRRAQADAAGRFRQGAKQVQQDVEVGRQKRIEVDERLPVEADVVNLASGKPGVVAQRLAVLSNSRPAAVSPSVDLPSRRL